MTNESNTPKSKREIFFASLGAIVGVAIGYYGGFLLFLLILASGVLGAWLAKWYVKREKINAILINFIIWSNLLTWIIPLLGIFTGAIAIQLSIDLKNKLNTSKYRLLGILCIILSLANLALGIYIHLHS